MHTLQKIAFLLFFIPSLSSLSHTMEQESSPYTIQAISQLIHNQTDILTAYTRATMYVAHHVHNQALIQEIVTALYNKFMPKKFVPIALDEPDTEEKEQEHQIAVYTALRLIVYAQEGLHKHIAFNQCMQWLEVNEPYTDFLFDFIKEELFEQLITNNAENVAVLCSFIDFIQTTVCNKKDITDYLSTGCTYGSETPLHIAVCCGHSEVAELLIQHGAHLNALNKSHQTPLDCVYEAISYLKTYTPENTEQIQNLRRCKQLLLLHGAHQQPSDKVI